MFLSVQANRDSLYWSLGGLHKPSLRKRQPDILDMKATTALSQQSKRSTSMWCFLVTSVLLVVDTYLDLLILPRLSSSLILLNPAIKLLTVLMSVEEVISERKAITIQKAISSACLDFAGWTKINVALGFSKHNPSTCTGLPPHALAMFPIFVWKKTVNCKHVPPYGAH